MQSGTTTEKNLTDFSRANKLDMKPVVFEKQEAATAASEDTDKLLGLDKDWMVRAVKAVGKYGEIFERNVGERTPLALPRGLNSRGNKGGLMYAPPIR